MKLTTSELADERKIADQMASIIKDHREYWINQRKRYSKDTIGYIIANSMAEELDVALKDYKKVLRHRTKTNKQPGAT